MAQLQQNPRLDPEQQKLGRIERHFHWVTAESIDDGALLTLRKLDGAATTILGRTRLLRQRGGA